MTNMPPPGQQPPQGQGYPVGSPQPTVPFEPMAPVGTAPTAGPPPTGRSKLPMLLGALVVLAALAAGAFFLLKDDDDDNGGGAFDTKAAAASLAKVLDDAQANGAPGQCPTVDLDAVSLKAPKKLNASAAADGEETTAIQELGGKRIFTCIGTAGDNSVRVLAAEPFDDNFEASLQKVLSGFTIDFAKPEDVRGGTMQAYCSVSADPNSRSCAAQWFDKNLRVGVVSTAKDSTAEDAATWLKDALPDIVASVAKAAPGATAGTTAGTSN